ncbi:PREDICTED: mitogen-activated protein kinase kinase kinase YODA-like [Prunus mume]|uniref:Mitogen-activated protein kinase kinase kinase YODA-like n=1 Tax=Prunus mume TaxID=102107 RepID=A0ABM0NS18_PRUMU|nr:PREDICTED: mitogen-activated protein kinase kinase kinase YODA-like [Prunus mume]
MKRKAEIKVEVNIKKQRNCRRNHRVNWVRGKLIGGRYGSVHLATSTKPITRFCRRPEIMVVKSSNGVPCLRSVQHEAEVLIKLKGCPSVIECYGGQFTADKNVLWWTIHADENGEKVYNLFLEYASGGSLDHLIKKSDGCGLPESEVRWYTKSILEGVKHIHQCDYVHCDLTPENILLVPTTTSCGSTSLVAKIADFGLAKRTKENVGGSGCRGSPMYLSPEALLDKLQDQPSAIWSVGCIVLEMLTGKPPWDTSYCWKPRDFLNKLVVDSPKIPAKISKEGRDFLKICLAFNPCKRLTAEELLSHPFVAQSIPPEEYNGASQSDTASVTLSSSSEEVTLL